MENSKAIYKQQEHCLFPLETDLKLGKTNLIKPDVNTYNLHPPLQFTFTITHI